MGTTGNSHFVRFREPWRRWWVLAKPNPHAKVNFFCFPYAGGSASIFHPWRAGLPEHVEMYSLQLPGRANRIQDAPFTRVSDLVPEMAKATRPLLDRQFAFFGHSLGAILSFEVARWLRNHRQALPQCLFVSGRRSPQILDTAPPSFQKNDEEFLAEIAEAKGTPAEVLNDPELVRLLMPTLRADFELAETYRYIEEEPLPCAITAFGATDDEESRDGKLEAWRVQTSHRFSFYMLDGDHFFMHASEKQLLKILHAELTRIP
jgi:medium-chain acyl-[acyl-carrier-protein] hydrolase